MLSFRRVLRSPASRYALRSINPPAIPVASRSFATSSTSKESSRKWPLLIFGGLAVAICYDQFRLRPEQKEQRRLLELGEECVKQGNVDQAIKYFSSSFGAVKPVLNPTGVVKHAMMLAALCESLDKFEDALPYYLTATQSLKEMKSTSSRFVVGVELMDKMGHCYHNAGRHEPAEKAFKKGIGMYETYRKEFSASPNNAVVAKLDTSVMMLYTHYAMLLVSTGRDSEVKVMRERFGQVVRKTPLESLENNLLNTFDDVVALQAVKDERRRDRQEEYGM